MNGIQSLASAALNLFREFVPGNPDVARFWLENGAATLSLLVVLGLLLRFFGSENARPGLLLLSGILGIGLLAAGPSAIEIYALPNTSPSALAAVDTVSQWTASRIARNPWPARTTLLSLGFILSLLFVVVPLTRLTFRVPGFLALLAWLAALATAGTVAAVVHKNFPSAPPPITAPFTPKT